ncbi:MBL fold metallo-hydrolase [Histidinibacterium lentulum]|uniref:MBL fold metallo-hydrolase n=1 Tax=Histidinibacterium lentulum TaxID=2480588 RepID=A0A3N2QS56_9RHOB|nr:MBL fold metallo-hydrolase [Histidinibacterium lentulum]ROT97835.1 MBL fold metallo-hydrolase [Histidinibacterium lentulum]
MKDTADTTLRPEVTGFFDDATNTVTYVVKDPGSNACAIVDSVMDIDYAAGRITYDHADRIIDFIRRNDLRVEWLIETHVHADHLSGAPYLQRELGGKLGIGRNITIVQETFGKIFNEGTEFQRDGSQFDALFEDGDTYEVGGMTCTALHTPGHTPACMTHVMGDAAFVGDTLFMPDFGTARCDFPGGSSEALYESIQKILALPDETRIFVGHDYLPPDRDSYFWETTVAEQKARNIHVGEGRTKDEFVEMRDARDATLAMPRLIVPSLQVNMRAGNLPPEDDKGNVFLKVPVNKL